MTELLTLVGFAGLAFVVGGFPFGLFLSRLCCDVDIRQSGSGNTGATNVARNCGTKLGVVVLALDMAKGFLPAAAVEAAGGSTLLISVTGFAALLGHCFSPFLGGKGGKAVATSIGMGLAAAPGAALMAAIACLATIWKTGYVSAGSLVFAWGFAAITIFTAPGFLPLALATAILITLRHRDNIARLMDGTEKSWMKKQENGDG